MGGYVFACVGLTPSPSVTKLRQSYHSPQGTRWLNFGRSRSVGELCALLNALLVFSVLVQSVNVVKKIDYSLNSELRKLQFFGAGPKTALPSTLVDDPGWSSLFNSIALSSIWIIWHCWVCIQRPLSAIRHARLLVVCLVNIHEFVSVCGGSSWNVPRDQAVGRVTTEPLG